MSNDLIPADRPSPATNPFQELLNCTDRIDRCFLQAVTAGRFSPDPQSWQDAQREVLQASNDLQTLQAAALHRYALTGFPAPKVAKRLRRLVEAGRSLTFWAIIAQAMQLRRPSVGEGEGAQSVFLRLSKLICVIDTGAGEKSQSLHQCTDEFSRASNFAQELADCFQSAALSAPAFGIAHGDKLAPPASGKKAEVERPATPTPGYCLILPNKIRWEGETEVQPRFFALLEVLLNKQTWPVSFEAVEEVLADRNKYVSNAVSKLNQVLEPIKFPWTFRTKSAHITRD